LIINIAVKTESLTLRILLQLNKWAKGITGVKPEKGQKKFYYKSYNALPGIGRGQ